MSVHSEKLLMLERMADELIRPRECAFPFAYAEPRICVGLVIRITEYMEALARCPVFVVW